MKAAKTYRHDMAALSGGNTSTLKKARRMANILAGNRPRSGIVALRHYEGDLVLHPTKGWRRA